MNKAFILLLIFLVGCASAPPTVVNNGKLQTTAIGEENGRGIFTELKSDPIQGENSSFFMDNSTGNQQVKIGEAIQPYPDTDDPPVLTLYWEEEQNRLEDDVLLIGQFGAWEGGGPPTPFKLGYEPNSEMEISLKAKHYPLYAFTKGTITYIQKTSSALQQDNSEVTIRFGRKYALKHMHINNLSEKLNVGDRIEAGDFIGYTPIIKAGVNDPRGGDFTFLEIELDKVINSRSARAINPFDYFDNESKAVLEKIRLADKTGIKQDWVGTTSDKSKSWIPYVGKTETWADMHKIGYEGDSEHFEEFARNNNLGWVLENLGG